VDFDRYGWKRITREIDSLEAERYYFRGQ